MIDVTSRAENSVPVISNHDTVRLLSGAFIADLVKAMMMTVAVFFFIVTFIVQGFKVYGCCMEPNLSTGERLLGNKLIYHFERPSRGEVVVFRYPKDPSRIYIKRVIGLPGETVEIRSGSVYVNGRRLNEPYIRRTAHGDFPPTYVERGNIFVLGDFRDASNDSRYWGELPLENVQAKAWLRYWPVGRIGFIR